MGEESLPEVSSPKRPYSMDPRRYCFACQAMISYAIRKLGNKNTLPDLLEVVDQKSICNPDKYVNNDFRFFLLFNMTNLYPDNITDGCEAILASYEEELIYVLQHRYDKVDERMRKVEGFLNYDVAQRFCIDELSKTRACFGIKPDKTED